MSQTTLQRWCPCEGGAHPHEATAVVHVIGLQEDGEETHLYAVPACSLGVCAYEDALRDGMLRRGTRIEVIPL